MKSKKLIGIIACVLILLVTAFCLAWVTACKSKGLDTPEGFQYSSENISWEAVDGADGYMVHVNKKPEFYITDTSVSVDTPEIKGGLIDKALNVLNVSAVKLDKDGGVKISSASAEFDFDYIAPVIKSWTVTLDLNYANSPKAQTVTVKGGEKLTKPDDPERFGWTFGGWYRDKQCQVSAEFTAGVSNFGVTADTTLYAKWTKKQATTSTVYFYSGDWEQVIVKPYDGETQLFADDGIEMAAVAGKTYWFKADIDDLAKSVIFTDGKEATESALFDRTKPYCKDGEWTSSIPVEEIGEITHVVSIKVGDGEPQQLEEDPDVEGEFIIDIDLEIGDTVVIAIDGEKVSNYSPACRFKGTATLQGKHTFYVSEYRTWVDTPPAPRATVYYYNSGWDGDWPEIHLYCWDDATKTPYKAWPGEKMTALGGGWFVLDIEAGYDMIIFSGKEGNQTDDLNLVVVDGLAYYDYNGVTDLRPDVQSGGVEEE